MRENVGGPRLETDQPGLLEAIIDLVQNSTAADDKRRSEILRTTRTLVELHPALLELGYILCKTSLYYRCVIISLHIFFPIILFLWGFFDFLDLCHAEWTQ